MSESEESASTRAAREVIGNRSANPTKTQMKTMNQILDAAIACYAMEGATKITLEQVAKQAGVTRTTLYRYISNREDLLSKVLHRDALLVYDELAMFYKNQPDFGAAVVNSLVHTVRGRMTRPINKILFPEPGSDLGQGVSLSSEMFYDLAYPLLEEPFKLAQEAGRIRDNVTLDMAVEWITRITLAYINNPGNVLDNESEFRHLLETMLVPALVR